MWIEVTERGADKKRIINLDHYIDFRLNSNRPTFFSKNDKDWIETKESYEEIKQKIFEAQNPLTKRGNDNETL